MSADPISVLIIFNLPGPSSESYETLVRDHDSKSGYQGGHWGIQHEDKNALHLTLAWGSQEDHEAFKGQPEYSQFVNETLKWSTGPSSVVRTPLRPHPPPVETAPVTEWCTVTLSEGTRKEDFEKNFKEVDKRLRGEGYHWHSSGWVIGNPRSYLLLIGWDSVKAHADWRESDIGKEAVKYLSIGVDDIHMVHVKYGGKLPGNV